jgi:membrane fusion protein, adhesin transport system
MSSKHGFGTARLLIWGCAFSILGFLLWADWAEIDQITRASGQVITSSRNQVIQVMDGGVLSQLPVKEGSKVSKGQLLARFDRTKAEASYLESRAKEAALLAMVARLRAEIFGGVPKFPAALAGYEEFKTNQLALFGKRQDALHEEIGSLEKAEALVKEELEMNMPLLKTGDVSRADILRLQRQILDIRSQVTNKKSKYFQDSQADLVKAEEDLAGLQQVVTQRKDLLVSTDVLAPMDGIVRNVRLTTLGGVARPGDEIMQLVPIDEDLVIEAKIKPADIAFIKIGLPATIKFDAYDYSIYGSLRGNVTYVSADTLADTVQGMEQTYYRVHIKVTSGHLLDQQKQPILMQPGMTTTVEVMTGTRSVLHYLTKPITKTLSESLGER